MGPDDSTNQIQLPCPESVVMGKSKWLKPELAGLAFALHMNVRRLIAVEARKEKTVRPGNTLDPRYSEPLPFQMAGINQDEGDAGLR